MVVSMTGCFSACGRNHRLYDRSLGASAYDFLGRVSNRIINEVNGISPWCMTSAASRQLPLSGNDLTCTMNEQNPLLLQRVFYLQESRLEVSNID